MGDAVDCRVYRLAFATIVARSWDSAHGGAVQATRPTGLHWEMNSGAGLNRAGGYEGRFSSIPYQQADRWIYLIVVPSLSWTWWPDPEKALVSIRLLFFCRNFFLLSSNIFHLI